MPFLSWTEGSQLLRHSLDEDCLLGREAKVCAVARPSDGSVSRRHASVTRMGQDWWLRDLGSRNGTHLNGLPVNQPFGNVLLEGDQLSLGDWTLTFTLGFPGLDPDLFLERVGDLFVEARRAPDRTSLLLRGLELLQRSTEAILQENAAEPLIRSLLTEALKLLGADRGFVVLVEPDRSLRSVHRVGTVQEVSGLSRTVLDYVLVHRTAVGSNAPLTDPRFGGQSLMELGRGALMAAPLGGPEDISGILYVDRGASARPFTRFDLALFQAFVRHGSIALRHTQLSHQALGHAEMERELSRARAATKDMEQRQRDLQTSVRSPLGWARALAARTPQGEGILLQLDRVEALLQATGIPMDQGGTGHPITEPLKAIHATLLDLWRPLLEALGCRLEGGQPPEGSVWMARGHGLLAVQALAEPLIQQLPPGQEARLAWREGDQGWCLDLHLPGETRPPVPEAWVLRRLRECGLRWQWERGTLTLIFQREQDTPQPEAGGPVLGLIECGEDLLEIFQVVADAHDLELCRLEATSPEGGIRPHRSLVLDAANVVDPVEVIQHFRRQAAFAAVPILVVRPTEDQVPELLAAGATDWLPAGFRWEALHHRLQALRGHAELQTKALAAERLDSFRQMAGTLKHEINNPLAVISMQVEMLQMKYADEPRLAKIDDMVGRIQGLLQVLQKMREATPEAYADGSKILKLS